MFHEPTELLWIVCLTGSIWTPKFQSVTLTPNTRSQTSWPKGTSDVMSGIIFFICSILAFSALFAAPKISAWFAALRWQKEFRNKKKEKRMCPSRDQQWWMCLLILCRQVPQPLQVRLHQNVRVSLELRGDLVAEWILSKFSRRSFNVSSEIKGCIPRRVDGTAAGRPAASKKRNFRRNWGFKIWAVVVQACCSNWRSLWETTCSRNSRIHLFSVSEKSKQ